MSYRSNKITIRAGSQERITFILKINNQVYDLTNFVKATLRLKDIDSENISVYNTDDVDPILSFDDDLTSGKIHLDPKSDTFTNNVDYYAGYIDITHSNGKTYPWEEDEEFGIEVRDKFVSS